MSTLDALEQAGLRFAVRDHHQPKAKIFQPGPPPERIYFLLEGAVRIYK